MLYLWKKFAAGAVVVYVTLVVLMLLFAWSGSAIALSIDEDMRTVPLTAAGEQTIITVEQFQQGQAKFSSSCAQCHIDGGTKTNTDVDLSAETLMLATPSRNSVEGILAYLHEPMTYDGLRSLAELHPSTQSPDLFPRMRGLSSDDLDAIAGYILVQPKIVGDQWAGGKPKR